MKLDHDPRDENLTHLAGERPAFPLHGPALVRHLVFRLRQDQNPRTDEGSSPDASRQWDEFCRRLGAFVNAAKKEAGRPGVEEFVRGRANGKSNQHSLSASILIPLSPGGEDMSPHLPQCRLRIRIDVHTELFTVTISADQFKLDGAHVANQRLRELIAGEDRLSELHDIFWTSKGSPMGRIDDLLPKLPDSVKVVDFRGIIIPTPPAEYAAQKAKGSASSSEPALSPGIDQYFRKHRALLDHFLTKDATPPNANEPVSDGVLCSMLAGRALYVAPLTQWVGMPRPVRYLLVADDLSPDQLGRLVRRMHVLGELRHVALFDFDLGSGQKEKPVKDLKLASRELRKLSRALDKLVTNSETGLPTVQQLAGISKQLTALHNYADGGLPYRVSQSHYYAQAFKDRLPDLRVGRVEGYQPYDAFARRFVYQVFARIEQVGQLYRTVVNETNRWTFLSEASSSAEFHAGISEATKEIKVVGAHLVDLQQHARDLLLNAEKFAAIFLVYYVGSIFAKFLHTTPAQEHAPEAAHGPQPAADTSWFTEANFNMVWGLVVIVVILDLVRSKRKREKADKDTKREEREKRTRQEAAAKGEAVSDINERPEKPKHPDEDKGVIWFAYRIVQIFADAVFFVIERPFKFLIRRAQPLFKSVPRIRLERRPPKPPTPPPAADA